MGRCDNSPKVLWQQEEVLMSFRARRIFRMQKIIFTEKCVVITTTPIESISTALGAVVPDLIEINAIKSRFGVIVPILLRQLQSLKNMAAGIMMNSIEYSEVCSHCEVY